jgi:predicted amidophosphoribosyltransferase
MNHITLCSYCEQPVYPAQKFCGSCGNEVVVQKRPVEAVVSNVSNRKGIMENILKQPFTTWLSVP